ncbi:conserved hypothetical protein [Neospora caninum Liverpool]|uniref:Uncharacterized protein n=1 Tax=Neospora caninum (strain Liverpool) TaxID=572307 RepID=F0VAI8_NEOCL|nr:conserved hypothetical protein [Neospora caninum Liverpool]CBZ50677.1 conserved hypothetical protein [Neospora caninum Liverpool]CEL65288.1 TPA: hypothetical protein BN1204_011430 [Neospora caninum Liverpool]|eukprot:XP_003880710.1 conserved hypothetical protein [Neospora caninum Liverpool]
MLKHVDFAPSTRSSLAVSGDSANSAAFDENACLLPFALAWGHSLTASKSSDGDAEPASEASSASPAARSSSPALPTRGDLSQLPSFASFRESGDVFVALDPFMEKVLLLPPRPNARAARPSGDASPGGAASVADEKPTGGASPRANAPDGKAARLFPPVPATVIQRIETLLERPPVGLIGVARYGTPASPPSPALAASSSSSAASVSLPLPRGDPQVLVVRPLMVSAPSETGRKRRRGRASSAPSPSPAPLPSSPACSLSPASPADPGAAAAPSLLTDANYAPFPTTFWLSDELLRRDISTVEVQGGMKLIQQRIGDSADLQKALVADHLRYIAIRWLLLDVPVLKHFYEEEDRATAHQETDRPAETAQAQGQDDSEDGKEQGEERSLPVASSRENHASRRIRANASHRCPLCRLLHVLRERGIGGIGTFCAIRCLHMHYAFHLALPPTTVGAFVDEELAKLESESPHDSDL